MSSASALSIDAGLLDYGIAWAWQKKLSHLRRDGKISNLLIFLEHPPVFTTGKRDVASDFLLSPAELERRGYAVYETDRGGKITYHAPGQLVGYLIWDLRPGLQVSDLVCKIQKTLQQVAASYRVRGEIDLENPGLWLQGNKLAAIGLHIEKGITTHGFALNVSCDLEPYTWINPCGFEASTRGVTSLEIETDKKIPLAEVRERVCKAFESIFDVTLDRQPLQSLPPEQQPTLLR